MAITAKMDMIAPPPWWNGDRFYYVCEPAAGLPLGAKIKIMEVYRDIPNMRDFVLIRWGGSTMKIEIEKFNQIILRRTPTKEAELAAFGLRLEGKQ